MRVTRVVINTLTPKDIGTCATCTITLDDSLLIHQVKIISGEKGLFVAFPADKGVTTVQDANGKTKRRYNDVVHPCNEVLRRDIIKSVIDKYNDAIK